MDVNSALTSGFYKFAPSPSAFGRCLAGLLGWRAAETQHLPSARHTSRVVFNRSRNNQMRYAVDASGGGRSSAIIRKMSAKRVFGTATSAIWKTT
jgi:hypothetical protein